MKCLMDHIVLNVEDVEKMIGFYSNVLDMKPERVEAFRAGQVPFPSVRLNADTIIDLFPKEMWKAQAPDGKGFGNLNHFCISLEEGTWKDLFKRLEKLRVAIHEGPVPRWGAHGTGTSIYFKDPESNIIEARYYEGKKRSEKCMLGT